MFTSAPILGGIVTVLKFREELLNLQFLFPARCTTVAKENYREPFVAQRHHVLEYCTCTQV